jgi:NAD(P)-dependent dehydrogenase (short-subunit alcohol dehydrogenase family)
VLGEGRICLEVADGTDPARTRRVAQRAVDEYGRLDTWVHAAAVLLVAPFERTTPEEFQRVIDVNLMGQVHGAMAALPHLKRRGGALIHITSMGAKRGVPLQTAYCASKHGIDGFVETLRMGVRREKLPISVTNIMPATINTPLSDQARTKIGVKPVAPPHLPDRRRRGRHPVRRAPRPGPRGRRVGAGAHPRREARPPSDRPAHGPLRVGGPRHRQPKPADAPDNLFAPLDRYDTARDGFDGSAWARSLYTSLQRQPIVKRIPLAAEALAVAGFVLRLLIR